MIESGPARAVGGRRSVCGIFRSTKMEADIQTESRTVEWAFAVMCEHDPDVLIFLDQPCHLSLSRKSGPPVQYTPDFLVLSRTRGAELIETKPEETLEKLADPADGQPWRYQRSPNGDWVSPPAAEAATRFGLGFRIVSSRSIPNPLVRNYAFLDSYVRTDNDLSDETGEALASLKALVKSRPGIPYNEARQELGPHSADTINFALAKNEVWGDLCRIAIADGFSIKLYQSRELAEVAAHLERLEAQRATAIHIQIGARFVERETGAQRTIVKVMPDGVLIADGSDVFHHTQTKFQEKILNGDLIPVEKGTVHSNAAQADKILHAATANQIKTANARYRRIEHLLSPKGGKGTKLTRSDQRYLRAYRDAETTMGVGYVGLLPAQSRGNTTQRIDPRVAEIIEKAINDEYLTPNAPSKEMLWGIICAKCAESIPPLPKPTRRTINRRIKALSAHKVALARFGSRIAASVQAPRPSESDETLPRYGDHPWAVGHIDHTQLDVELVSEFTGTNLGRPWLTILVAPKYNRVLARFLTFDEPSYRSCQGVIRDCVQRHRRLPETLVTDNGVEFHGRYLDVVLRRYGVHQQFRPPGQPQFGSVLERFNSTLNTRLLHVLDGQTRIMKNVRESVKTHNPKALATMSYARLSDAIDAFLFEYHDNLPSSQTNISPKAAFEAELLQSGERSSMQIIPDQAFFLATMPTTETGMATVSMKAGITIHRISYWNPKLRFHHKERVPVRYDPQDLATAYAQVDGEWLECRSRKFYEILKGVTEKERLIFTAACHRNGMHHERYRCNAATHLARFLFGKNLNPASKLQALKEREETIASRPPATAEEPKPSQVAAPPVEPPILEEPPRSEVGGFGSRRKKVYETRIVPLT